MEIAGKMTSKTELDISMAVLYGEKCGLLFALSDYEEVISNSNWTEWSTIQGVIARVISKSDECEARGRFEITSTITP